MATIKDILNPYLLTDSSLNTSLITDLGMELYRPVVYYSSSLWNDGSTSFGSNYESLSQLDFHIGDNIKLTQYFIENFFGPAYRDLYIVVYPTDFPTSPGTNIVEFPGIMIVSFERRYDDIYRKNIAKYVVNDNEFIGGAYYAPGNGLTNPWHTAFPFGTVRSIQRIAESNGDLVIPVLMQYEVEPSGIFSNGNKHVVIYNLTVYPLEDFNGSNSYFEVSLSSASPLMSISYLAIPVYATSVPNLEDISYDALIYGIPFSINDNSPPTNTITSYGMSPVSIRYNFTAAGYSSLWDETLLGEDVGVIDTLNYWPNPILDSSNYVDPSPIITFVNKVSEDYRFYVESYQPLFFIIPEFKFPVDGGSFTGFYFDVKEAVGNTCASVDVIFFPSTEGTKTNSTTANWLLYADNVQPSLTDASARFVLYGPLVEYGDGSLESPEMVALRSIIYNFAQTPHLPPAGIPRGVVGGVVTTHPFLNQYIGDAEQFLQKHINPVMLTSPGGEYAIMGNFTLYPDETSYKSRVDTMILTRLIRRVLLSAFARVIFNSPSALADTAREAVRRISGIPGVALFEVANISYDSQTRTGTVEFNLYLEGVVEKVLVVVNVGMGGQEVIL